MLQRPWSKRLEFDVALWQQWYANRLLTIEWNTISLLSVKALPVNEGLIDRTQGVCFKAVCRCSITLPFQTPSPHYWLYAIIGLNTFLFFFFSVALKPTVFGYKNWHCVTEKKKKVLWGFKLFVYGDIVCRHWIISKKCAFFELWWADESRSSAFSM